MCSSDLAPRSGRSALLRTLAAGIARTASPADVHLYGLVDTDTKNTQELIAPEVAAAIPPPPRRHETEAVTEPPSNSEVIPQKTESAVPVSDLVTEAGDIDALLEKHGLLDILDEPATETEVTVNTTIEALQPAAGSSEPKILSYSTIIYSIN